MQSVAIRSAGIFTAFRATFFVATTSLALFGVGCGESPPPAAATTLASSASAASSAVPAPSSSSASEHHHELNLPPAGPSVSVSLDGKSVDVVLANVPHEGTSPPFVLAVWKIAFPNDDPAPLKFDMFGSDGFHPSAKAPCARVLTGANVAAAHIDIATHNITYDNDGLLPGCYNVKGVVKIVATH